MPTTWGKHVDFFSFVGDTYINQITKHLTVSIIHRAIIITIVITITIIIIIIIIIHIQRFQSSEYVPIA